MSVTPSHGSVDLWREKKQQVKAQLIRPEFCSSFLWYLCHPTKPAEDNNVGKSTEYIKSLRIIEKI